MLDFLLGLDSGILLMIQAVVRQEWLTPLITLYTHLGDSGMIWILLCAVLLIFPKTRRAGVAGCLALCFSLLCTNCILKPLVGRTRPWLVIEGLLPLIHEGDLRSFPSGHTSAAFAAGTALLRTLPKAWARRTVMVCAVLMGLSRLYVGVHYPSDVLGGALVGTFCGWLAVKLLGELQRRYAAEREKRVGR